MVICLLVKVGAKNMVSSSLKKGGCWINDNEENKMFAQMLEKVIKKIVWVRWCMPIIPEVQETEAEES